MASNRRFGRRLPEWARREDIPGTRIDSGPFIGYVKNNYDPLRKGRLQVWIPELGGDENAPTSWRTVSYASPYGGSTYKPPNLSGTNNEFTQVPHTYGFWGTPPDINCPVMCAFIVGDPNRGYWFACINTDTSHYMVPGLASGNVDTTNISDAQLKNNFQPNNENGSNWPVVEFNEFASDANTEAGFVANPKPPHEVQTRILLDQGLDRDKVRGAISSSSQRESPSYVFGISTPGRPMNDPAEDPTFAERMREGTLTDDDLTVKARKGGHTFVMDDGDQSGKSQLIRLRSAGGHQILMNDSDDVLYIANTNGTAWVEFTGGGHISMYAASGIHMRTEGDFNLHADKNINFNSGASINFNASVGLKLQSSDVWLKSNTFKVHANSVGMLSSGEIKIQGASGSFKTDSDLVLKGNKIFLNTSTPSDVAPVPQLPTYSHSDTSLDASGMWVSKPAVFDSIVTVAPGHEPWARQSISTGTSLHDVTVPVAKQSSSCSSESNVKDPGPLSAKGFAAIPSAPSNLMFAENAPRTSPIGRLTTAQVKAILVQIGYGESNSDFSKIDLETNRIGKYQINTVLLKKYGYLTADDISSIDSWAGKDGIRSMSDWVTHTGVQDSVMILAITDYMSDLQNVGAIQPQDDVCVIAGMVCVAYYFRDDVRAANAALNWRMKANTPGVVPYNWGRYAVDILAQSAIAAVAPPVVSAKSNSGIAVADVINFTNGSGDLVHYNMLGADIKTNFELMAKEFKNKFGRKLTLSSAVRTLEEQTKLYNAWFAASNGGASLVAYVPGYGHILKPAKPSPNSPHIKGIALDISRADLQQCLTSGLLDKYKFCFPLAYDIVHIQVKG